MLILDMGCGYSKEPDSIGVDMLAGSDADVLANLARNPLPFQDNSFDAIYCNDVLEHLPDVIATMEEIWRIGKADADVYIVSPSMSSAHLHNDPTHLRGFTSRSFDYFIEGEKLFKYAYSPARFKKVSVIYDKESRKDRRFYDRWVAEFATKKPLVYEHRLAFILPLWDISFHLQVEKKG
ncbi:MAG: methyltransferase domain-containing protein [Ghiorsea sp.]